MIRQPFLSRAQRSGSIAGVLLFHAMIVGLFLAAGRDAASPVPPSGPMMLIDVAVAAPELKGAPPPPPALPSKVALVAAPPSPPSLAPSPTATAMPGGGCATLASVTAAINSDESATTGVRTAPPELRSIAGAVVVWNTGWSEGARGPGEPLEAVRRVIETTLRGVDPACLEERVAGPRLVAVPTGDHSMYVVLGSGMWSWRDLLNDEPVVDEPRQVDREPRSWFDWL